MVREKNSADRPAKTRSVKAADRLLSLWRTDRDGFDEAVEIALADQDEGILIAALGRAFPNDALRLSEAIETAAETLELQDGCLARLVAVPVLVDARDGDAPDAAVLCAAVAGSGLLPVGSKVTATGHYFPLADVAKLGPCGRRALLEIAAAPEQREGAAPPVDPRRPQGREVMVLLLGVILDPAAADVAFLEGDEDLDPAGHRAARLALLRSGGGIVDVGRLMSAAALAHFDGVAADWLGRVARAHLEVPDFLGAAAEVAGEERLDATLRRVGTRYEVRLRSASGALVDSRLIDPWELPIVPTDLERAIEAGCRSVVREPDWDGTADFVRPRAVITRERAAPRLTAILGGRLVREAEEQAAWRAGMQKRMADLRGTNPLKAD